MESHWLNNMTHCVCVRVSTLKVELKGNSVVLQAAMETKLTPGTCCRVSVSVITH